MIVVICLALILRAPKDRTRNQSRPISVYVEGVRNTESGVYTPGFQATEEQGSPQPGWTLLDPNSF